MADLFESNGAVRVTVSTAKVVRSFFMLLLLWLRSNISGVLGLFGANLKRRTGWRSSHTQEETAKRFDYSRRSIAIALFKITFS
jgi:hypothetical protein